MVLLLVASVAALALGSVGLYGVVSYMTQQRQREIAIRMAIGARRAQIHRLVLTDAGWMAGVGTVFGLRTALAVTRQIQSLLFETSPFDPVVFCVVSALLAGVCGGASWLPAHRAATVPPASILRAE